VEDNTMENRISTWFEEEPKDEPQPIGEILEELFDIYEARFRNVKIAVVETPAGAI
jgi:hypothetical protein